MAAVQSPGNAGQAHRPSFNFRQFAQSTSQFVGTSTAFAIALGVIGLWAASGPLFHYSDTWQLVINTGTTVVTFLMVFLIQHTQNRDTEALRLKLDELIRAVDEARNEFIEVDDLDETEIGVLQEDLRRACRRSGEHDAHGTKRRRD